MKSPMKCNVSVVFILLLLPLPASMFARQINEPHSNEDEGNGHYHDHGHEHNTWTMASDDNIMKDGFPIERTVALMKLRRAEPLRIAGSKLPDCSHACGSCSPCRLVTVSNCALLTESETCPMAYRCMCNDKSYPVP